MMTWKINQFGGKNSFCSKTIPRENSQLIHWSTLLEASSKNATDLLGLLIRCSEQAR